MFSLQLLQFIDLRCSRAHFALIPVRRISSQMRLSIFGQLTRNQCKFFALQFKLQLQIRYLTADTLDTVQLIELRPKRRPMAATTQPAAGVGAFARTFELLLHVVLLLSVDGFGNLSQLGAAEQSLWWSPFRIASLTSPMALVTSISRGQAGVQLKMVRQRQTPLGSLRMSRRFLTRLIARIKDEAMRLHDGGRTRHSGR